MEKVLHVKVSSWSYYLINIIYKADLVQKGDFHMEKYSYRR